MPYRLPLSIALLLLAGCFNRGGDDVNVTGSDTEGTDTDDPTTTDSATSQGPGTVDPTTTVSATDTDPTGDTDDDPVCGDGQVEGDEVCDDGVNDGSYGSCLSDCSGQAEHCGDGEVNGPEVCDDGVNDGGYNGCASDCTALGPHCGDGVLAGDHEMCDDGEDNENGAGCNIDCTTSGTVLGEWSSPNLGNCSYGNTNPVFRENDNILIVARGTCQDAEYHIIELTPAFDVVDDEVLILPTMPYRAVMRGDDWLLAGWECNFWVHPSGQLDEVCETDRITGTTALDANDDGTYLAMNSNRIARFDTNSPVLGDTPAWSTNLPTTSGSWSYYWLSGTFGPSGSMFVGGEIYTGSGYIGHMRRYSAAGNQTGSNNYNGYELMQNFRLAPDGSIVGFIRETTNYTWRIFKVAPNLTLQWNVPIENQADIRVDSAGDIVVEVGSNSTRMIKKFDPGGNERWSVDLPSDFGLTWGQLGIDSKDSIVRAVVEWNPLVEEVNLRVTRVSP